MRGQATVALGSLIADCAGEALEINPLKIFGAEFCRTEATMYMGSHNSASQIRVLQWPDSSTNISWSDVNVRPWSEGAYSAPGPGGVNWLNRLDGRITGAWVGGGTIGFMWSANRDANHPLPYAWPASGRRARP